MTQPQKFNLDTKTIFLTIPQTDVSKELAYDRIIETYKTRLNCFIVSHEKHKDEGDHLHVYINFKDRFRTSNIDIFDFIGGKHPNIQSARSPIKVIKYVVKEGDYLAYNIDVNKYLKEVQDHKPITAKGQFNDLYEYINKSVEDNSLDMRELNNLYGSLMIKYSTHIQKYIDFVRDLKNKKDVDDYYNDFYANLKWNKYQDIILKIVDDKKVDNRKINWIYDNTGGKGKSTISNYLELYKDAYIITGGKQTDIYRHYKNNKIVIYDLPRDYVESNDSLYATMENFKNGYILDTKYEGQKKRFIPPKIIVFSNNRPDIKKLSLDRWNIIDLEEIQEEIKEDIKDINEEHRDNYIINEDGLKLGEAKISNIIDDINIIKKDKKTRNEIIIDRVEVLEKMVAGRKRKEG